MHGSIGHVGETIWGNILLEYSPSSTGNSRNWDAAIKSIIRKWQDLGIRHMAGPDVWFVLIYGCPLSGENYRYVFVIDVGDFGSGTFFKLDVLFIFVRPEFTHYLYLSIFFEEIHGVWMISICRSKLSAFRICFMEPSHLRVHYFSCVFIRFKTFLHVKMARTLIRLMLRGMWDQWCQSLGCDIYISWWLNLEGFIETMVMFRVPLPWRTLMYHYFG